MRLVFLELISPLTPTYLTTFAIDSRRRRPPLSLLGESPLRFRVNVLFVLGVKPGGYREPQAVGAPIALSYTLYCSRRKLYKLTRFPCLASSSTCCRRRRAGIGPRRTSCSSLGPFLEFRPGLQPGRRRYQCRLFVTTLLLHGSGGYQLAPYWPVCGWARRDVTNSQA